MVVPCFPFPHVFRPFSSIRLWCTISVRSSIFGLPPPVYPSHGFFSRTLAFFSPLWPPVPSTMCFCFKSVATPPPLLSVFCFSGRHWPVGNTQDFGSVEVIVVQDAEGYAAVWFAVDFASRLRAGSAGPSVPRFLAGSPPRSDGSRLPHGFLVWSGSSPSVGRSLRFRRVGFCPHRARPGYGSGPLRSVKSRVVVDRACFKMPLFRSSSSLSR